MTTILFFWAVVASQGVGYGHTVPIKQWRAMGEFATPADCQRGAKELGLDPKQFRCITTGKKP